jgi:hypothetical protein
MELVKQSQSTRKQSASADERRKKRREKWPIIDGYGPVEVDDLGGSAALVTHATRGGVFLEYGEEAGTFHAVPVESLAALGFADPAKATASKK